MNKITAVAFDNELEKISSSGMIGDVLTASFLASLLMTGAQHGKGIRKAFKSGATFREALKSDPLPIGKEWRYSKLTNRNRKLRIPTRNITVPFKGKAAYEHYIEKQKDLAKTVGVPLGFAYSQTGKSKKDKK